MKAKVQLLACVFMLTSLLLWAETEHVTVQESVLSPLAPGEYKVNSVSALNTRTGQTLVIWEKHPNNHCCHSLYSRLLSPSGAPVSAETLLVSGPNTYNPSIVYNPVRNEFVMVYANEIGGQVFAIYGQRLTPQGRTSGPAVKISQDDTREGYIGDYPMIAYDAINETYVVVWQRFTGRANSAPNGLQGIVVGPTLAPSGAQVMLRAAQTGGFPPHPLKVAMQPAGGRLFVVYGVFNNNPAIFDYYLVKASADLGNVSVLKLSPTTVNLSIAGIGPGVDFLFLPDGSGSIFYSHTAGIKRRRFDATGKFVGAVTPAFRAPVATAPMSSPAIVSATTGSTQKLFLFGVQNRVRRSGEPDLLWVQELDASGGATGAPQNIDSSTISVNQFRAIRLPRLPGGTKFRMAGVTSSGTDSGSGMNLLRMLDD